MFRSCSSSSPHHVLGLVVERPGDLQRLCRILCLDSLQNGKYAVPSGNSGSRCDRCRRDGVAAGCTLIQQRQGITHTAVRQMGDQLRRCRVERKGLLAGTIGEPCRPVSRTDAVEVIALAA